MSHIAIWLITLISILLMLCRPFNLPEVVWTSAGAVLLCALRLIPLSLAAKAVAEGTDVYLFLTGMMLLSELGKLYGVFDWMADIAVKQARGSPSRLFTLIYAVGTLVTVFMSNDATAVVLTPAVLAAVKRAKAEPMPHLLTCALIANAASFVLPISNPANLVVFQGDMPPLGRWIAMFSLPSLVAVLTTYFLLRRYSRKQLAAPCLGSASGEGISSAGRVVLVGIVAVAAVLLVVSAMKIDLGLPTCVAALLVTAVTVVQNRSNPLRIAREISWSVLPLVGGLFIIVEAVQSAGAMTFLSSVFARAAQASSSVATLGLGTALGFGTDLVNNLPLGLIAGATLRSVPVQPVLARVVLIAIDLGPNLSITGSLATILWLISIRREGLQVTGWQFLKAGIIIMPVSLLLSLAVAVLI